MPDPRPALARLRRTARRGVRDACAARPACAAPARRRCGRSRTSCSTRWACSTSRAAARAARRPSASRSTTCRPCRAACCSATSSPPARRSCWCTGWSTTARSSPLLRRALRRRGFGQVLTLNYSPFTAGRPQRPPRSSPTSSSGPARTPVTSACTSSATRSAASSPATTCSAWAATRGCTRCAPSAARTPARPGRPPAALAPGAPAAPRLGPAAGAGRAGPRLPHPLRRLLERPRPAHRARSGRPAIDHPDLAARNVLLRGRRPHVAAHRRAGRPPDRDAAGPPRRGRVDAAAGSADRRRPAGSPTPRGGERGSTTA